MLEAPVDIADTKLPRHIAIIMDGNGRWAKQRHLPRAAGHREGAEAVRRTVTACREMGIQYLTIYAFSSENWKRPADEVDDLMGLLRIYLRREIKELDEKNVRLRIIGDRRGLAEDICQLIDEGENATKDNTAMVLSVALNYGSQAEIVEAVRRIAKAVKCGDMDPDDIDEKMISNHMYTKDIPDPDLLIRTSGEQRLSNFLLWQSAYAELIFIDEYWPDFDKKALATAIDTYASRERRFGAREN
ncbi:MAG: isoprenyl transferase [Alphaproteobacteria bacterium]|nr:MAG: isoprenyl transferase [Alphaproteobacteria bacterium]